VLPCVFFIAIKNCPAILSSVFFWGPEDVKGTSQNLNFRNSFLKLKTLKKIGQLFTHVKGI
jgi:hypothetical protein